MLLAGCTVGPDYVRPTVAIAAGVAHRHGAGRRPGQHPLVAAVRRPGAEPADRRRAAQQPRPADRRGAGGAVHRPAADHASAVLSADRLWRRCQPQPQQPRRRAAAGRRRRPLFHALQGRAVRAVAGGPVRPRAPAERSGAGPALCQRAGTPRGGAVADHQRGRQLHRAARRWTGSWRSRRPRPPTWPTRKHLPAALQGRRGLAGGSRADQLAVRAGTGCHSRRWSCRSPRRRT
jgi:hypothetical protein